MPDAVLFDLDGTLTDPAEGLTASFRHALASVGSPVSEETDLTWMIGPPIRHNLTRFGLAPDLHDAAVAAFRERHLEVGLFEATLIPGIVEVLETLTSWGVPLALATAKPVRQAHITLDHFGLSHLFAGVAGVMADGHAVGKDRIVADARHQLAMVGVEDVVMVGDRVHDIDGGRANGCTTVAVEWGFAEPGEMDAAAPDHRVAAPADLIALFDRLRAS